MGKHIRNLCICFFAAALVWLGALIFDRQSLNENLIRLHVVANSDSAYDQAVKLKVRDAVIGSLQQELDKAADVDEARAYIRENLPKLEKLANQVLRQAGVDQQAVVTLCREAFDTRVYDTFTLPAGVYEALRITIGEGEGHNWWCVAFPSLCLPATSEDFREAAQAAGFSGTVTRSLTGEDYQLRFFLLDAMGRLENMLFGA